MQTSVGKYLSLIKFSHTIFALPFAVTGFCMAVFLYSNSFSWYKLLFVVLCMVFARSAAMAFNRYLDREFDKKNPRTMNREIPAGAISPRNALLFVVINCILFVATTYFINPICLYLAPVALFVILFYSYTKRFTALCHIVLGLGLGLAPIGAFLAVTGHFAWPPILLSLAVFLWTAGFDIIYSLQDDDFDKGMDLYSIPGVLGRYRALAVSRLLHLASALLVIYLGVLSAMGILYWIGVIIFISMLVSQHRLVRPDDLSKVGIAFGKMNGIASVFFAIFAIADMYVMHQIP